MRNIPKDHLQQTIVGHLLCCLHLLNELQQKTIYLCNVFMQVTKTI